MTPYGLLRRLAALAVAVLVGEAPVLAEPEGLDGPAASAIDAYLKETRIPCYTQAGDPTTCAIAEIGTVSRVFYGAFTGQPAPVAVAFVDYQEDPTGRMVDMMAVVLRDGGGQWRPIGRAMEIVGRDPHAVRFGAGTIHYEGVVGPDPARNTPKAQRSFVLTVSDRGVGFVQLEGR